MTSVNNNSIIFGTGFISEKSDLEVVTLKALLIKKIVL